MSVQGKADAARNLEAYFLRRVLSEANTSFAGSGVAGSTFQDMFNEALADQMARGRGVGLARMIEKQLPQGNDAKTPPAVPAQVPLLPGSASEASAEGGTGRARVGRVVDGQRVYSAPVERLRDKVEAMAQRTGIPAEFMLAWINHESGGKHGGTTYLNERGLFQIMGAHDGKPIEKTEAGSLGLTEADHQRLSTDVDYSLEQGARLVSRYRGKAEATAKAHGLQWGDVDLWRLTKLFHTGPAFVDRALKGFEASHGRAPTSWAELYGGTSQDLQKRMEAAGQIGGVLAPRALRRYSEASEISK